ncbi:MAG: hypothetical protein JWL81_721 [Verrucomicrobiales bacterium]|nr:hypothetical protein [Verrucomicrobiales bacterium]
MIDSTASSGFSLPAPLGEEPTAGVVPAGGSGDDGRYRWVLPGNSGTGPDLKGAVGEGADAGPGFEGRTGGADGTAATFRRLEALAGMQQEVLGMILNRQPLSETLVWIVRRMEEASSGELLCSIFMAEEGGKQLKLMAAPSLPAEYNRAINLLPVGEGIGSCGTAAARGEVVVVEDILNHPAWALVRGVVAGHPLRACWSMPVISSTGRVLGTLGIYHGVPRGPSAGELEWAAAAARLTGLAMERTREAEEWKVAGSWLEMMLESLDDAFFTLDAEWRFVTLNRQTERLLKKERNLLLGREIWDVFPEAVGSVFEVSCREAAAERKVRVFDECQEAAGRWLEVRIHPSELGLAVHFRDVTTARQAAVALRDSEERFKSVARATADALWDLDIRQRTLWWSDGMQRLFGYAAEEVGSGLDWWAAHVHPGDRAAVVGGLEQKLSGEGNSWSDEYRFLRRDGSYAYVMDRGFLVRNGTGHPVRMVGGMTDLTERRRSEQEAREVTAVQVRIASVQREIASVELNLQAVIDLVADRVRQLVAADGAVVALIEGEELIYSATSGAATCFQGLRVPFHESLSGRCVREGRVLVSEDPSMEGRLVREGCRAEGVKSLMVAPLRSGALEVGVLKLFSRQSGAFTKRDEVALEILAESLGVVILNHLTASRLKASEAQYRLLFENNPLPMWTYDTESLRILAVNRAAVEHYGYSEREFQEMSVRDLQGTPECIGAVEEAGIAVGAEVQAEDAAAVWIHRKKDGSLMEAEVTSGALGFDGRAARLVMVNDVTERRRGERELARLNRAQRMLSGCNEVLFRESDERVLLEKICGVAVDIGNYRMAWIGYAREDEERTIEPVAFAGAEYGYLSQVRLSWSDRTEAGRGPAGITIRSGQPFICEDIMGEGNGVTLVWREEARERGYHGIVCLPLKEGERTFGLMVLWSANSRHVAAEEITLLKEMAEDTAFGILNVRARAAHAKLQEAVVKVASSVTGAKGTEFFQTLADNMADALGAVAAVVGRLLPGEPAMVRTLSVSFKGVGVPNFDYPLEGSPCGELRGGDECVVRSGVSGRFPTLTALRECGAESYAGRVLRNAEGAPVGMIYLLFREPLIEPDFVTSTLKIFAARAASELQRQDDDARIRQQASLLDQAQDAILVRDFNQSILFWNQGAERLYGWTAEQVDGRLSAEVLGVCRDRLAEAQKAVLEHGEWNGVLEKVTRDGRQLVLNSRWTLLRDADDHPKSILSIDTDITEKQRLEQQFLRAQRMESIGTLAGGIAHDLNNVLAPIMMSIDLLKLTVAGLENRAVLDTIADSARRGAAMVSQVLSFARGMEGRRAPVSPAQLVEEIGKIARDTFPKNIRIQTLLPPGLWTVEGDHTQLHQVLLNLCVNARDAMPEGGTINLSAANLVLDEHYAGMNLEARPGPCVMIQAEDNGTGMPPAVVEKIFDPFFTTKELGKGTGLGLSTSLAIIKSHGGFLRVYSEAGKGTVFRLYLPATPREKADVSPPPVEQAVPRGRGELILVIDDEPSIGKITKQTLESFGYRVVVATDGAEGVTIYAEHRSEVAAVLTDMMMPVMDGPSTIHVLTRMNPSVRIIAASGISSNASVARAAGAAVRDFLPKPYTAPTLLRTLRAVLDAAN